MDFFRRIGTYISLFFSKIYLFFDKHIFRKLKEYDLIKRILFTLAMMAIFVVIGTVTLPGVTVTESEALDNSFVGIMNTIGGGGLRQFSLVSLGISPFITSSLVMMFLQTKLFPPVHRLYQSGPSGRIKINYITLSLTLFFSIIQAMILIQSLKKANATETGLSIAIDAQFDTPLFVWFVLPLILVSGTFFSIFISEQITNKGVGNGTSMLILSGSIISIPQLFSSAWSRWVSGKTEEYLFIGLIYFFLFLLMFVFMVFIVSFFYQAERRIPIQQTGVGRSKSIKDISYLPIKLNPSGIMPVIFASMLVTFPLMIVQLVSEISPNAATRWMLKNFSLTSWIGISIFAAATFGITIFLSLQQAKIDKIVEDFNKVSTFIPGIRPGEQTEDYLISIVLRLSFFSAIYLTILGSSQYVAQALGANPNLIISGTSIMIVATVSIETLQQIEARWKIMMVHKKDKNNKQEIDDSSKENQIQNEDWKKSGSILW